MLRCCTIFALALSVRLAGASLRCQNQAGSNVDYWTGVKFPRPTGTRYTYTDNTISQTKWTLGADLAATSGNPLSATLAGLYSSSSYGYVMWNVSSQVTQILHFDGHIVSPCHDRFPSAG